MVSPCRIVVQRITVNTRVCNLVSIRQIAVISCHIQAEPQENGCHCHRTDGKLSLMRKQALKIEMIDNFDQAAGDEQSADQAKHGPDIIIQD